MSGEASCHLEISVSPVCLIRFDFVQSALVSTDFSLERLVFL
jgi:hypothetical protein